VNELWHDLMIAVRGLAHRRSLALGITLTIGLGIGATTTIYGIVDGVVLRPLPYADPGRLVALGMTSEGSGSVDPETGLQALARISTIHVEGLRERALSFQALGALQPFELVVSESGADEVRVPAARFSAEIFQLLAISPALGRTFLPEEFAPVDPGAGAGPGVAMISHGYWQRRYGGDPNVIGRPLEAAGAANPTAGSEIVGILPQGFVAPETFFPKGSEPDVVIPLPPPTVVRDAGRVMVAAQSGFGVGRLAPGVTVDQARREAERLAPEVAEASPIRAQGSENANIGVNGLHEQTIGDAGRSLWIFLGAAGLLLLLSILNAATLLLARTLDRGQELGVRTALGAGRGRIVRLLLGEAGVLAVVGGLLGVLFAYAGIGMFLRFAPENIPRLGTVAVNGRVLVAALAVSLGSGLLVGLLPALRTTARAPWERLQKGARSIADSRSVLRSSLIGGQLALAVVLLSGAALLFGSFMRVRSADPGFEVEGLMSMSRSAAGPIQVTRTTGPGGVVQTTGPTIWDRWDPVIAQISSVPGVQSAVGASDLPFQPPSWAPRILLPEDDPETVREGIAGYAVTPGFFEGMGIEIRQGRGIEAADAVDAERVAVVNEAFVRTFFEGRDPLDLVVRRETAGILATGELVPLRIVGVVEDVVQGSASDGPRPAVYIPHTQADVAQLMAWNVAFRTDRPLEGVAAELRGLLQGPQGEPPRDLAPMSDRIAATHVTPRFQAMLIGSFASVALFLAAMGLYGSLAQAVRWRQREIGVRMALGADRPALLRMVLRDGMRLSGAGLLVGLFATVAMSRVLASLLYDIEPTDPATLLVVATILILVSVAASLAPARRATAVDPVRVLKSE